MLNTVEELARQNNVPFHDFNGDYGDIGLNESMGNLPGSPLFLDGM